MTTSKNDEATRFSQHHRQVPDDTPGSWAERRCFIPARRPDSALVSPVLPAT